MVNDSTSINKMNPLLLKHKHTTTYYVRNPEPGLGQASNVAELNRLMGSQSSSLDNWISKCNTVNTFLNQRWHEIQFIFASTSLVFWFTISDVYVISIPSLNLSITQHKSYPFKKKNIKLVYCKMLWSHFSKTCYMDITAVLIHFHRGWSK